MSVPVAINPVMLQWALERAELNAATLKTRFGRLSEWLVGTSQPSLGQLEQFSKATRTPFGYFFLPTPPVESIPIPDFRTKGNERIDRPSPDLLETIFASQQRQDWYREDALIGGKGEVPFVGSIKSESDVVTAAQSIRSAIAFPLADQRSATSWTEAVRRFIERTDAAGILVMVSGIVGSNTRRVLDPGEFRGFALVDRVAPLIFVNGADTQSAKMFTLAHELVHVAVGQSALSDVGPATVSTADIEKWCNRVAAEILVPLADFETDYDRTAPVPTEASRIARRFKVSTLVILRRMLDAGGLTRERFWDEYNAELERLKKVASSGGDFYLTTTARVGRRFAHAMLTAAAEGRASFTEASRLLGFSKAETLRKLGQSVGVDF